MRATGPQMDLFGWQDPALPPMAALHKRLRGISPDAPAADWWEPACDGRMLYCHRHHGFFKRRCPDCQEDAASRRRSA